MPIHPALVPLFLDDLRVRAHNPEPALFAGVQGGWLSYAILTQTLLHGRTTSALNRVTKAASKRADLSRRPGQTQSLSGSGGMLAASMAPKPPARARCAW